MSNAAVRKLLQVCHNFNQCIEQHLPHEPLAGVMRHWNQLAHAAIGAGAPAELVRAVIRPQQPFADGLLWVDEQYRKQLLAATSVLIAWCEGTCSPAVRAAPDGPSTEGV